LGVDKLVSASYAATLSSDSKKYPSSLRFEKMRTMLPTFAMKGFHSACENSRYTMKHAVLQKYRCFNLAST
jgi:hypothetical protein